MTRRTCPWCGGPNLVLVNCAGMDPRHNYSSYHYWEDQDCGYREKTSTDEVWDDTKKSFVPCEPEIISFHKPRPPLPEHQQPEYLRKGAPAIAPKGQITLGIAAPDHAQMRNATITNDVINSSPAGGCSSSIVEGKEMEEEA